MIKYVIKNISGIKVFKLILDIIKFLYCILLSKNIIKEKEIIVKKIIHNQSSGKNPKRTKFKK